jgi:hypothetical protein
METEVNRCIYYPHGKKYGKGQFLSSGIYMLDGKFNMKSKKVQVKGF